MKRSLTGIRPHFVELASALLISPNQLTTTPQFSSSLNGCDLPVTAGATLIYLTPKAAVLGFYKSFFLILIPCITLFHFRNVCELCLSVL